LNFQRPTSNIQRRGSDTRHPDSKIVARREGFLETAELLLWLREARELRLEINKRMRQARE
jgi:hypothetical protein